MLRRYLGIQCKHLISIFGSINILLFNISVSDITISKLTTNEVTIYTTRNGSNAFNVGSSTINKKWRGSKTANNDVFAVSPPATVRTSTGAVVVRIFCRHQGAGIKDGRVV